MRKAMTQALLLAVLIVLAACTSNSAPSVAPGPAVPAPVIGTFTAAAADAGDVRTWDIQAMTAQRLGPPGAAYTEIVVSTNFEEQAPNDGVPNSAAGGSLTPAGQSCIGSVAPLILCGQIEIDTDNNAATGANPGYCAGTAGTDFTIDVGTLTALNASGQAVIFSNATGYEATPVGAATIVGNGATVNVYIPISAIGGSSSGPFNVSEVWGDQFGPNDCAPALGFVPSKVQAAPASFFKSWVRQ